MHSQLSAFVFKPAEPPKSLLSFGFLKAKDAPADSRSLEEFVACVIKDKPANVDRFFAAYVLSLFTAAGRLEHWLRGALALAPPDLRINLEVAGVHQAALAACPSAFTADLVAFAKSREAGSQQGQEPTDQQLRERKRG